MLGPGNVRKSRKLKTRLTQSQHEWTGAWYCEEFSNRIYLLCFVWKDAKNLVIVLEGPSTLWQTNKKIYSVGIKQSKDSQTVFRNLKRPLINFAHVKSFKSNAECLCGNKLPRLETKVSETVIIKYQKLKYTKLQVLSGEIFVFGDFTVQSE